jgi:hypothetical protein
MRAFIPALSLLSFSVVLCEFAGEFRREAVGELVSELGLVHYIYPFDLELIVNAFSGDKNDRTDKSVIIIVLHAKFKRINIAAQMGDLPATRNV